MVFSRKSRMVKNRSITDGTLSLTSSSFISRNSVSLAFLVYGLNGVYIIACDIGKVYLNAPCLEKIRFAEGPEHRI